MATKRLHRPLAVTRLRDPNRKTAMPAPNLAPLLILVLPVLIVVRRMRRQFGRQPLQPRALAIRSGLLALVMAGLVAASIPVPEAPVALAAGAVAGLLVALVNLRLTRFEWTPGGDFYFPHPAVGAALGVVLVARLAYRYTQLSALATPGAPPSVAAGQSPLTLGLMALLIGYYLAYALGLIAVRARHHR